MFSPNYFVYGLAFLISMPVLGFGQQNNTFQFSTQKFVPILKDGTIDKFVQQQGKKIVAADKLAIIVCDMWDTHHCYNAAQRVVRDHTHMNLVLEKARAQGAFIIHAPRAST